MRVQKRNGDYEDVSFDKILKRIKSLCTGPEFSKKLMVKYKKDKFLFNIEALSLYRLGKIKDSQDKYIEAIKLFPDSSGVKSLKSFGECFLMLLGNKLHISLYFPILLVPIKISVILFIFYW